MRHEKPLFQIMTILIGMYLLYLLRSGIVSSINTGMFVSVLKAAIPAALTFAIALTLIYVLKKRSNPKIMVITHALLLVFCFVDLFVHSRTAEFALSKFTVKSIGNLFESPVNTRVHDFITNYFAERDEQCGRIEILGGSNYSYNFPVVFKTLTSHGYNPLRLKKFDEFSKIDYMTSFRNFDAFINSYDSPLFNLLGARLIVVNSSHYKNDWLKQGHAPLPVHFHLLYNDYYQVYENDHALPRAFFVADSIWCFSECDCLKILLDPDFDPHSVVILEPDIYSTPYYLPDRRNILSPNSIDSTDRKFAAADILRYEPTEVKVRVSADLPGYMVLTDIYFPGWQARVNGTSKPVFRAYYIFRAVPVGAGESDIELFFKPFSRQTVGFLLRSIF